MREKREEFRRPFSTKTSHEDLSKTLLARFERRGPCRCSEWMMAGDYRFCQFWGAAGKCQKFLRSDHVGRAGTA